MESTEVRLCFTQKPPQTLGPAGLQVTVRNTILKLRSEY